MGKITFILGGARSGKSSYAIKLAKKNSQKVAFIATCQPLDEEMQRRIKLHKKIRPSGWQTFEEPRDISALLEEIGSKFEIIIIDCLTLWISGFILKGVNENAIAEQVNKLLGSLERIKASSVIVSNEVGLGIVPDNKLARNFRDIAGRANQLVAEKSDEVLLLVAGIPWRIKQNG